ncbi:unnamed protein product [Prorocentrum cordatum]|uniref:Uncharacterized protein n=1 Tax=Prorocentrum cordatum TaxID=2364126 RepID=A0ABN9S6Y7_9DINO|nr:unnamed protein product [Polarella glacialis]
MADGEPCERLPAQAAAAPDVPARRLRAEVQELREELAALVCCLAASGHLSPEGHSAEVHRRRFDAARRAFPSGVAEKATLWASLPLLGLLVVPRCRVWTRLGKVVRKGPGPSSWF